MSVCRADEFLVYSHSLTARNNIAIFVLFLTHTQIEPPELEPLTLDINNVRPCTPIRILCVFSESQETLRPSLSWIHMLFESRQLGGGNSSKITCGQCQSVVRQLLEIVTALVLSAYIDVTREMQSNIALALKTSIFSHLIGSRARCFRVPGQAPAL